MVSTRLPGVTSSSVVIIITGVVFSLSVVVRSVTVVVAVVVEVSVIGEVISVVVTVVDGLVVVGVIVVDVVVGSVTGVLVTLVVEDVVVGSAFFGVVTIGALVLGVGLAVARHLNGCTGLILRRRLHEANLVSHLFLYHFPSDPQT